MISRKTIASKRMENKKKGFTLTEIAIVLGIMGLILGAIWVAAAAVYNNQRVNTANTEIMQIAQGVRNLYATSSNTGVTVATDATATLVQANAVPTSLVSGTTLAGPFTGGQTAITYTADGDGFIIAMSKVTQGQCTSILSNVGGTSRDPGLWEAAADTTAIPAAGTALASPATAAAALAAITSAVTPASALGAYGATIGQVGGCTAATGNTIYLGFTVH